MSASYLAAASQRAADATGSDEADAVAAHTLQTLVDAYGFDTGKAKLAVATIGDKSNVSLAVSWYARSEQSPSRRVRRHS